MNTILRTYHIGNLSVSESEQPDTVVLSLPGSSITLTEKQFRALCGLANSSIYNDYVRFQREE